jgi:hypothetical protein
MIPFLRLLRLKVPAVGALRHHNFRIFIVGQFVSLCGTWMQTVALSWLVLELTNSALKTSRVTVLNTLPVLLLVHLGGKAAQRVDKRKALIVLLSLFLVEALVLGVVAAVGHATEGWVYALALLASSSTPPAFWP